MRIAEDRVVISSDLADEIEAQLTDYKTWIDSEYRHFSRTPSYASLCRCIKAINAAIYGEGSDEVRWESLSVDREALDVHYARSQHACWFEHLMWWGLAAFVVLGCVVGS